jgi:photosystem II stability/assembly factor-like uncharacterized protein
VRKPIIAGFMIFCCALLSGGRVRPAEKAPDGMTEGVQPLAPAPAAGADGASAWTAIGPYGGEVQALARNSKFPNEIYAAFGSYPSQIFRSTTGAKTWTRTVVLQDNVVDIATDPKNANVVYAYSGYRIYRSSDRAATFPESIAVPNNFRGYAGRMAIHPTNPKILILTGSYVTNTSTWTDCPAVARTKDGGKTWTVIKFESTSQNGDIFDIGIHPKNPNVVYVCGQYFKGTAWKAGVFRSTNGGGSYKNITKDAVFNPANTSYPRAYAVALHPTDPNTALVGHSSGIARTTNGGGSWENQSAQGWLQASALAADKTKPNTFYGLGASNSEGSRGCWKSVDGGKNWTHYGNGIFGWGTRLLVSGNTIIAGTWAGIFKSLNAGVLWKASHTGIRATRPDSFAVAPSSPLTIYTEIGNYALFKTVNGGGAWTKCPDFYRCESILGFIVHPSNPKTVFFLAGG